MKKNLFFIFILFSLFLFFGCIDNTKPNLINETELTNNSDTNNTFEETYPELDPSLNITITTDEQEYKSSQQVNVTIEIDSNVNFQNASLSISAINNRFKEDRQINLTVGNNIETYLFKLPRCNVCGGIREGEYSVSTNIVLNNITFSNLTTINVKQ